MARISAGVATSHIPAVGAAIDLGKTAEPYWQPVFRGYEFSKRWIAERKPDVVVLVYNDHASAFSSMRLKSLFLVAGVSSLESVSSSRS